MLSAAGQKNLKCIYVDPGVSTQLDALPVEEGSISLDSSITYSYNPVTHKILIDSAVRGETEVCFRTVSEGVFKQVSGRDINTYAPSSTRRKPSVSVPIKEAEIFEFEGIESFGSISRGVSFGNRQSLFVNSALNLQMDGKLTDDLRVSAVITDQNIPYQPEGNTQQLRDFDNVFIKLYNDDLELIAGDVVLQNPVEEGYFLRYYKNVQGLSMKYNYDLGKKWKATSQVSGSSAKGQFASTQVMPIEGVQGPYKLRGPNGERFIIVLANSEKVYIDGQLMQRGFDRDYVIDYNLGEVTFSNTVVITRFTRIRIDFEYADQFYGRSNITFNQQFQSDKVNVYLNYYREKDNPNTTLGFSLQQDDLNQLANAGDLNNGGVISGIDSVRFTENNLMYEKRDTIDLDGNQQVVYVYSTDAEKAHFDVSFTEVGQGNGDYIFYQSQANGKLYRWVSRQNGVKQGNYDPIIRLPTPNKKEMYVAGSFVKVSPYEKVYQETAISNTDRNLFSGIDDNDNIGVGFKGGISSDRPVSFLKGYRFRSHLTYEYDQKDFNAIDRFRTIEFDRNWNYDVFADSINRSDQIVDFDARLERDGNNAFHYHLAHRNRQEVVNGIQQSLALKKEIGVIKLSSENFMMGNEIGEVSSQWIRSVNDVSINTGWLNPGYQFSIDQNSSMMGDSIFSTLMHYHSHNLYLKTSDTARTQFGFDYEKRYDQLPADGVLGDYTEADEFKVGVSTSIGEVHKIKANLNYRIVEDKLLNERSNNLLGKLDWVANYFDGLVKRHMTFSTANTRELKREFVFISVPTGEGTHTWRDENGDGIKDLNEFYEAFNFDERNYIKLFSPSDDYLQAYQTTYLHTVDVRLPYKWRNGDSFLSVLSRFSFNANIRVNFKTTSDNLFRRVIPVFLKLESSHYLFARSQQRFTLFYNRNAPGFGFDLSNDSQASKSLLSNGYELKEKNLYQANARMNFNRVYVIRIKGTIGNQLNQTDFFTSRDFKLTIRSVSPEFIWQPTQQLRFIGNWESKSKRNLTGELNEFSTINTYGVEATWLRVGKGSLNASLEWVDIEFDGDEKTYLGYELLEALSPGANQRWRIDWQQSLGKGLQLNLQYLGRKSKENRAVHTGTAQLTAYF